MDQHVESYVEGLLQGNMEGCEAVVDGLLENGTPIREVYEGLFSPSLHQIGRLWETNQISVAREHLATAITERLMARIAPTIFSSPHLDRKAVVSCSPNELHQVGGRMVADILEMNGWHSHFLGANTPLPDLLTLMDEEKPHVLALSLAIPSHFGALETTIREVRGHFRDIPIVLGGQAFRHGGQDLPERFTDLLLLDSLAKFEEFLKAF